jgi:LDH2 family malate/lactate/ureidoglycolate dehydrogenase
MVELLAGPLVGAAVADKLEERNWGNLVLVIDPQLLGEPDVIRARTQARKPGLCWAASSLMVHWQQQLQQAA